MAITYDWIFNPLTVKPAEGSLTDVVITVDWRRTANDGTYAASCYGQVAIGPADPSTFTPFADLTKAQVQGWVVGLLTQATVDQCDLALLNNIDKQRNPPVVAMRPPWEN